MFNKMRFRIGLEAQLCVGSSRSGLSRSMPLADCCADCVAQAKPWTNSHGVDAGSLHVSSKLIAQAASQCMLSSGHFAN